MIYNPLDINYKSIIGAFSSNEEIKFRVKVSFDSVFMMLKKDGETNYTPIEMIKENNYFTLTKKFDVGLYFYHFSLPNGKFVSCGKNLLGEMSSTITDYQLTAFSKNFETPKWLKGGIIYQIFPDRFCRGLLNKSIPGYKILRDDWGGIPNYLPDSHGEVLNNDFFGGDIKGIISKLDYVKSLNVTAIYLNPIFKAYSNHRYDTGNYMEIDPILGDLNDFKALLFECEKRSIKVILDGVFNHVGADSLYFNKYGRYNSLGAYESKDSPYYEWFIFKDYPNEYDSWWGIKTLPNVNEFNPAFQDYITGVGGVIDFYTKLGVGGWRLDVVDELPSQFVKKIRSACKDVNNDCVLIGEVWEDASNKISYDTRREYFLGNELDSVMNYPLKNAIIDFVKSCDCANLVNVIYTQYDHYPKIVLDSLMNMLSTHDTYRIFSSLSSADSSMSKNLQSVYKVPESEVESIKFKLKVATLLQFTLYGVPSIYYGDEIGMQGLSDPFNRGCFDWDKIKNDFFEWFKFLSDFRAKNACFVDGKLSVVYAKDGALIYKRISKNNEILVAINISKKNLEINFKGNLYEVITKREYKNSFKLTNNQFAIFYKKSRQLLDNDEK